MSPLILLLDSIVLVRIQLEHLANCDLIFLEDMPAGCYPHPKVIMSLQLLPHTLPKMLCLPDACFFKGLVSGHLQWLCPLTQPQERSSSTSFALKGWAGGRSRGGGHSECCRGSCVPLDPSARYATVPDKIQRD